MKKPPIQKYLKIIIKRKILNAIGYSIPSQIWIGVTYRCQCNCRHCFIYGADTYTKNREELRTDEMKQLIKQAKDNCIQKVVFFGGEPLLREDLVELVAHATSLGLGSIIFTNGILLEENNIQQLREVGVDQFNVSLDSSCPEFHDRFRGFTGCFEKAVAGIRKIVELGIKCSIWTYVSKEDVRNNGLKDLRNLIEFAKRLRVNNIFILFPIAGGKWFSAKDAILDPEERDRVRKLYDPPFTLMEFPTEQTPCRAGKSLVYINPYGEISPCPCITRSFSNIRRETLRTALKKINKNMKEYKLCGSGSCILNDDGMLANMSINRQYMDKERLIYL